MFVHFSKKCRLGNRIAPNEMLRVAASQMETIMFAYVP